MQELPLPPKWLLTGSRKAFYAQGSQVVEEDSCNFLAGSARRKSLPPSRFRVIMSRPPIPKLDRQPASVDFIDNRLPKYHPAFVNPPARYDPMSQQYVPTSQAVIPRPGPGAAVFSEDWGIPDDIELIPRPALANTTVMTLWNGIFPEAMQKFRCTPEPKVGVKAAHNIRDKHDWSEICQTLETARTLYQDNGTGRLGPLRTARRKLADNITPAAEATKFVSKAVPSDPYATPILSSVGMILDVRPQNGKGPDEIKRSS